MARRQKRKRCGDAVQLNLAAMLDMAFQLLAFFILTFQPAPIEREYKLHMPVAMPTTRPADAERPGDNRANPRTPPGLNSLTITAARGPDGGRQLFVGDLSVANLGALDARLRTVLGEVNSPFDQVLIQADATLRYQDLLEVVDVCTRQKLAGGDGLTKLSFVEMPSAR